MRAVYSRPGEILRGWGVALRGRRENPLLVYWQAQERVRLARQPWYLRNTALLLSTAASSALACYVLPIMQQELYPLGTGLLRSQAALQLFRAGALLVALLALLLLLVQLLSVYFYGARLALGFLEPQGRGQLRRSLDDLLAVSPLSEQELLLGLLLHVLRRAWLPLLTLSAWLSVTFAVWYDDIILSISFTEYGSGVSEPSWVLLPVIAVGAFLGGLLGLTNSLLLFVSISLYPRATLLPSTGAFMQTLSQGLLILLSPLVAIIGIDLSDPAFYAAPEMLHYGALFCLLLLFLSLYLARRWGFMRAVLGHSLAAPLLILLVPIYTVGVMTGDSLAPGNLLALSSVLMLQLFSPLPLWPLLLWLGAEPVTGAVLCAVILLLQLLCLPVLAGLARDAIQRRKWEAR